jgi:hypothetical protein
MEAQAAAPMILGPDGKQAQAVNHCVFWNCGAEIAPPHQFCREHVRDVPRHLRVALDEEMKWLRLKKLAPDRHFVALMNVIINRAVACRMVRLPEFDAEVQLAQRAAQEKEEEAKNRLLVVPKPSLVVPP